MSIEKLRPSFTFTEDRLRELQQVVPEAFADGKINWDTLREALGEHLEDEEQEHFGLTWPGKREARRLAAMPSKGTLVPVPGEGMNEENTHNIYIEGENLEVLKLLQKSYAGKIKMIYIDPPYNTKEDFLYEDDYSEPLKSYMQRVGTINDRGILLSTNSSASGRYHSKWLSMIYPRLLVAKPLLQENGVVFVSIGDEELHNLRHLMNEVFGEENFLSIIIRRAKIGGGSDNKQIAKEADYILAYAKNKFLVNDFFLPHTPDELHRYSEADDQGKYFWDTYSRSGLAGDDPENESLFYEVVFPDGSRRSDRWRRSSSRLQEDLENGEAKYIKTANGWNVHFKQRLNPNGKRPRQILFDSQFSNSEGSKDFDSLFPNQFSFSYPKPVSLIKFLINISCYTETNAIILDFFSGSATTAQAIFEINEIEEKVKYQFILVQLPELLPENSKARKAGYSTISQIGKERIRRCISKIEQERQRHLPKNQIEPLGFVSYLLRYSNFKEWKFDIEGNQSEVSSLFDKYESSLITEWSADELLVEVLLLLGFPLDSKKIVTSRSTHNKIKEITHNFCAHKLYICLDEKIADTTVETLSIRPEDIFVCLDTALTDEAKLRLSDRCQLKVI